MPKKKTTTKKTAPKEIIRYIPVDAPMSEIELAAAFNVQEDNPLRRAITQIINEEIDFSAGLTQGKEDRDYTVGWFNALRFINTRLGEQYAEARNKLVLNAQSEAPPPKSTGYA
jgi:hypothetical protein